MLQRTLIGIAWICVIALALWLRVDDLAARPIHFDEATGAHIFSERLENADYRFDPKHYHGPFQSQITAPIAKIYGQNSWQELSLTMLRTGPILAGMLLVLTPLLWLRTIGPRAALGASALLATSPLLVYYNRMYIHESWLALFGMMTAAAIYYVIKSPTRKSAILAGLAAGLMFATKETVVISLFCWTLAGAAAWLLLKSARSDGDPAPALTTYFQPAAWFILSMLLASAIFYTEFFTRPGGMIDAFRTYFVYETTAGHDKPFAYYLQLLLLPKHALGLWWTEGGISILGIVACALVARKKNGAAAVLFLAVSVLLHLLLYSLISYKTPWLMLLPWALACLLAGCALIKNTEGISPIKSAILYACFGLCVMFQTYQSTKACGRLSNLASNPYAYVPTSKNITQLPAWLKELEALVGESEMRPIAVIGRGYWPLPWYLRDFGQVGYWPNPPEDLAKLFVIISMPEQTAACNDLLADTHTALPRTLRSNMSITLYLKNKIWNAWSSSVSDL